MGAKRKKAPLTPIGTLITNRTIELNLSHYILARRVGITASHLSQILHGAKTGKKHMDKIFNELGIELEKANGS